MGKNGFYFAHGCYELISHLEKLIQYNSIDILLNHQVSSTEVHEERNEVLLRTPTRDFSAEKVIITPYVRFCDEGKNCEKLKFYHLYLLIHDPTPPKFSYGWGIPHTVRMINLTHFVDLEKTDTQLTIRRR